MKSHVLSLIDITPRSREMNMKGHIYIAGGEVKRK